MLQSILRDKKPNFPAEVPITFGKHKGTPIGELPMYYLQSGIKYNWEYNVGQYGVLDLFHAEIKRRQEVKTSPEKRVLTIEEIAQYDLLARDVIAFASLATRDWKKEFGKTTLFCNRRAVVNLTA